MKALKDFQSSLKQSMRTCWDARGVIVDGLKLGTDGWRFREFLIDELPELLDDIEDYLKGVRGASDVVRHARSVVELVDRVTMLAMKAATKYKPIEDKASEATLSELKALFSKNGKGFMDMLVGLDVQMKTLGARLVEGVPPDYEVDLGVPEVLVRKFSGMRVRVQKAFSDYAEKGYNPPVFLGRYKKIEKVITGAIEQTQGLGVDLGKYGVPYMWDAWDAGDTFENLEEALDETIREAL